MRALRFIAGAAAGLAIWWYATPAYNDLLCRLLHLFGFFLAPAGRDITAMRAGFTNAHIPADQLTYNVVIFAGLVAAAPPRILRAIAATIVVLALHAVFLAVTIEAAFTKNEIWIAIDYIYRIGGMFAIAFVCWYAATPARGPRPGTLKKSAKAGPPRPRAATTRR